MLKKQCHIQKQQIQELDSKLKNLKINIDKDESSLSGAKRLYQLLIKKLEQASREAPITAW